jgi:uncharacterized protein YcbX
VSAEIGVVSDLWRFPVKSFAGERLRRAFVGPFGIIGDRRHGVVGPDGTLLSARRVPRLLGFAAWTSEEDGEAVEVRTPSGVRLGVGDPALVPLLTEAAGLEDPVRVERSPMGLHDAAPLHVLSEPTLSAMSGWLEDEVDRRRFRANVVVDPADPEPFAEAGWVDGRIALGEVLIEVVVPTERCAVTTWDPDTLERDTRVLANIARRRENFFGVYARVLRPGWIAVGDPVRRG